MNIFKFIKEAVSVKDAASFYGLNPTKNNLCRCPFHNDRHPSMKVDERFYCFACGAKGDVIDFVSRLFHLNTKEATDKIMKDFHLTYHAPPPTYAKPTTSVKSKLLKYKEPGNDDLALVADSVAAMHYKSMEAMRLYAPHNPSKDFSTEYCNAVHNHFLSQQYLEALDYGSQPEKQALIGDLLSKSQTKKRMEEKQHVR